jgi:hypothetical protein
MNDAWNRYYTNIYLYISIVSTTFMYVIINVYLCISMYTNKGIIHLCRALYLGMLVAVTSELCDRVGRTDWSFQY